MTSNLSHEDYLEIKLKPIFNSLTESIVKEYPEDPVSLYLLHISNI